MLSLLLSFLFSQAGALTIIVLGLVYYQTKSKVNLFINKGIKYNKPLPVIGNMFRPLFKKESYGEWYQNLYNSFPNESVVGIFEIFLKPRHLVRDPELIKQITIKEFDSFMNHDFIMDHDPIIGKNLLNLRDQRWKDMRSVLTPAFTSSKMKFLFELVRKCVKNGVEHIQSEAKIKRGVYEFEAKDLCSRFANDVIASSAYGLDVNSIKYPDNAFYKNARQMLTNTIGLTFRFFIGVAAPIILKLLKIEVLDAKSSGFLKETLLKTIKNREQNNAFRPDMVQLLLQAKHKGRIDDDTHTGQGTFSSNIAENKWTDQDLVAQAVLFFTAGYDTVTSLLSFMAYELAMNPNVQNRLWEEINTLNENLNGEEPSFENIHKLKYMEMVMSEVLRKWPPTLFTDRLCKKKNVLIDSKGQKVTFNPGDSILLASIAFHRDPKYFPEPEKFDPERFSDDNKQSINQYAYQPFGLGPRSCIGNRFAIMECKIWFYYVLSKFKIETTEKTENPLKMELGIFQNIPANGIWLKFRARE